MFRAEEFGGESDSCAQAKSPGKNNARSKNRKIYLVRC